jgi:hypothetical protein
MDAAALNRAIHMEGLMAETEKLTPAKIADTIDDIDRKLCVAELACEGLGSDSGSRPGDANNVASAIYQCR